MYIPFVSLVKRQSPEAIFYRPIYTDSAGVKWWPNDAFGDPRQEIVHPAPIRHYRLDEAPVGGTGYGNDIYGNGRLLFADDTTSSSHVVDDGPCREIGAAYGRGGGQANPDVWDITYTGTSDPPSAVTGVPVPGDSDPVVANPAGITTNTGTLSCWFKISDLSTVWARDNSDDDDGTEVCIMNVSHGVDHGSGWVAGGWNVRLSLRRFGNPSSGGASDRYFRIEGHMGDGANTIAATWTSGENSTWAFLLNDDDWHLLSLTYSGNQLVTYIDGRKIISKSGSTMTFPSTPAIRLGINKDIDGGSVVTGCRNCQIAYASIYPTKVTADDLLRHYASMKRWFDHKVTDYHTTEPLATNSVPERTSTQDDHSGTADLRYSVPCLKGQYRHDGRYAHVLRLHNPWFTNLHTDYDDVAGTIYVMQSRLQLHDDNSGDYPFDSNIFRNEKDPITLTSGAMILDEAAAGTLGVNLTVVPGKVAVITGYDGYQWQPDSPPVGFRESSFIWNFCINSSSGGDGYSCAQHGNYATAACGGGNSPQCGAGGWALWRDRNQFYFFAPYAIEEVPLGSGYVESFVGDTPSETQSDPDKTHYATGGIIVDNRFQAVAFTVSQDEGILGMVQQPHVYPNASDKRVEYTDTTSSGSNTPPAGFGTGTTIAGWPVCSEAAPLRGMFVGLETSSGMWNGIPWDSTGVADSGGQGNDWGTPSDFATDKNRYGPTAICRKRLEEVELRRIMRIMHGQRLHRTLSLIHI